jgi:AcrR family transcriptional regulator
MSQPPPFEQAPIVDKPRQGRPPSQRARLAILETAYRILMEEGLGRMTVERVASQAGVGKPTIYRYWSNAQELAMAAFMARPESEPVKPDSASADRAKLASAKRLAKPSKHLDSSARAAIKAHLQSVIATFASNRGRQITLTMASADPESELAKAFRHQIILKSREAGRILIELGISSGEIEIKTSIETLLDMLYGPIFFRLLAGHLNLTTEFATQLADTLFDGIAK